MGRNANERKFDMHNNTDETNDGGLESILFFSFNKWMDEWNNG